MSNPRQIIGKVAATVTTTQLAFNVGANDGVEVGDSVQIFDQTTVKDPDSGELLGAVRLVRLRLRIVHVQEKLSVGSVTDTYSLGLAAFEFAKGRRSLLKKVVIGEDPEDEMRYVRVDIGDSVAVIKVESTAVDSSSDGEDDGES